VIRFIILLLLITSRTLSAAEIPNIFFKKISTKDGLSHPKINCIVQDQRGFIWFGSEKGLNRFDGKNIIKFQKTTDSNSISGNIISDLYEDGDGIMWIATLDGGMTKYNYRLSPSRQFKQFRHKISKQQGIPENKIIKIVEDAYGFLWLATSGSNVVRFNKKTEQFDSPIKKGAKCILALQMGTNDTLLAGRAGGNLLKINTRTLAYRDNSSNSNIYKSLPPTNINALFKDSRGSLWMGSMDNRVYHTIQHGAMEVKIAQKISPNDFPQDRYVSFAEDDNGLIWMAKKNSGIIIYNIKDGRSTDLRHDSYDEGTLSDDHINVIYKDHNGIIWVGTDTGVNMFNPLFNPFVKVNLPKTSYKVHIYDFIKTEDGRLLIGTDNGIYLKKNRKSEVKYLPVYFRGRKLCISKFFLDVDNQLYIGTDYTLFRYNIKTNKAVPLTNNDSDPFMGKLSGSRIVSILRDTLDNHPLLLVSSYGNSVTYYDLLKRRWFSKGDITMPDLNHKDFKDNFIRKLYKDRQNQVWLANFRTGLGGWNGRNGKIKYYINDPSNNYSLGSNSVYDIQEDPSGNLWISTYGGGIYHFDRITEHFYHVPKSGNLCEGLQIDNSSMLWIVCNGGIHTYNPLQDIYSTYDIPSLKNTPGVSGYLYKDNHGILYAAGENYYLTFDPNSVDEINQSPDIYITDFKISNTSYNHYLRKKVIELENGQDQITIDFSAPNYNGNNIKYSYKLEGHDHEWIDAGQRNSVSYANLKSGFYQFKIRADNQQGHLMGKITEINIIIVSPIWSRIGFHFFVFSMIAMMIYAMYRHRLNTILQQQAIRNGIAQNLHDQIGSTLSSIAIYGEVAKRYSDAGDQKGIIHILDTISITANNMVSEMGDIVWAINPKNDHMESVVDRFKSYAEPLCKEANIKFTIDFDMESRSRAIGMRVRKNLLLIMKETVRVITRHSSCSYLDMTLGGKSNKILLTIRYDANRYAVRAQPHEPGDLDLPSVLELAKHMNAIVIQTDDLGIIGTYLTIELDNR